MINAQTLQALQRAQRNEITEYFIYDRLGRFTKDSGNRTVLRRIAREEMAHYFFWKSYTHKSMRPDTIKIVRFVLIARLLGITFAIKLMEKGEEQAQVDYGKLAESIPHAKEIALAEDEHELELINMIDEERLAYVGSIVLGLNDALVELTGALAGFTLALQNTQLIAVIGLITGIAASLSMAASEYLSTRSEGGKKEPFKASIYTGAAYIVTVILLIMPYFLLSDYLLCLGITVSVAVLIILCFTYYISVAKDLHFKRRFAEMAVISLGIAAISFGIGYLIRTFIGVEI